MNVILVGPLASGKTTIAEELIKRDFCKESNYHSIEKTRRAHSSGTFSGEMFAWAHFLQAIEEPATNDSNIYEFSGTGRNVWNVSEGMKLASERDDCKWIVVYILSEEAVLIERVKDKIYDAPCPYQFSNPRSSIEFMNKDLKKTLEDSRQWASSPKIVVRTDQRTVSESVDQILNVIKEIS